MVSSGVVWCLKNDQWVPLQLSSIILHGALTKAQWAAISDFLKMVANQQVVVQDTGNGLTELSEQQRAVMQQQLLEDKLNLKLTEQQQTLLSQLGQQNVQFCMQQQPKADEVVVTEQCENVENSSDNSKLVVNNENDSILHVDSKDDDSKALTKSDDQWQNLVIQENGLIKLFNGKTELVDQEKLVSDNKKLLQVERANLQDLCVEKLNNGQITQPKQQMLMLQFSGQENKNVVNNSRKDSKVEDKTLPAKILANDNSILVSSNSNLFINNLFQQTEHNNGVNVGRFVIEQKVDNNEQQVNKKQNSEIDSSNANNKKTVDEHEEIVARLLQKYYRYNQQPLSDKLLNSIACVSSDESAPSSPEIKSDDNPLDKTAKPPAQQQQRTRKYGSQHDAKLYENFTSEHFDNERNEHVLRWLKEQNLTASSQDLCVEKTAEPQARKLSVPCGTILGGRRVSIGTNSYPPKLGFRRTSVPCNVSRSRKSNSVTDSRKSSGIFSIESIPEGIKSNHDSSHWKVGWLSAPQSRKTSVVTPPENKNVSSGNMKERRRFSVISFSTSSGDNRGTSSAVVASANNSSPDCSKTRKDSIISTSSSSRKGSVVSNSSFSEDLELDDEEEPVEDESKKKAALNWPKLLKKHLGGTKEKKQKRQKEQLAESARKLSSGSEIYCFLASEP